MRKPIVAFICVHNSCRSQIAEFLAKKYASESMEVYSAGTKIKDQINQDAVKVLKKKYKVDINDTQYSKLIKDIPSPDIVIKMGCEVSCPFLKSQHEEDWGLEDPTGKEEKEFEKTIQIIKEKIMLLKEQIDNKEII
ncbi:MAG: arsenate reductase ArsC [Coprobacillaceae bacterium]